MTNEFPSHIRDTGYILNIVDEFNRSNLLSESILFGFGIKNIFPSNDNNFGLKNFFEFLDSRVNMFQPTESVIELLLKLLSCV